MGITITVLIDLASMQLIGSRYKVSVDIVPTMLLSNGKLLVVSSAGEDSVAAVSTVMNLTT